VSVVKGLKQAVWDQSLAHPHHPWKQPARRLAFFFRLEYFFMFWFALAGPCCVLIMACTCYWRLRFEDLRLKMTYDPTEIVLISDYKAPTGAAKGSLTLPASMYVLLHVPAHFACPFVSRTEHAFPDTPPPRSQRYLPRHRLEMATKGIVRPSNDALADNDAVTVADRRRANGIAQVNSSLGCAAR